MFIELLQTVATVIVALTTMVAIGGVAMDERYEVSSLKINEHEGFGERA